MIQKFLEFGPRSIKIIISSITFQNHATIYSQSKMSDNNTLINFDFRCAQICKATISNYKVNRLRLANPTYIDHNSSSLSLTHAKTSSVSRVELISLATKVFRMTNLTMSWSLWRKSINSSPLKHSWQIISSSLTNSILAILYCHRPFQIISR